MNIEEVILLKEEAKNHLVNELLPFWTNRMKDDLNGGFITHFDKDGNDTGEDEKSLIAQTRCLLYPIVCTPCGIWRRQTCRTGQTRSRLSDKQDVGQRAWRFLLDA